MENGTKISELASGGALRDTDELAVRRGALNRRIAGSVIQGRIWRPEIDGLSSGSANALDAIVTVGLPLMTRVDLYLDSQFQVWLLMSTGQGEDGVGIIWPDDYDETTNIREWVRVL